MRHRMMVEIQISVRLWIRGKHMKSTLVRVFCGFAILWASSMACTQSPAHTSQQSQAPLRWEAMAFVARAETQLDELDRLTELAGFTNGVDGSPEHEKALEAAKLNLSRAKVALWKEAAKYENVQLPPDVERKVRLLRVPDALPSPFDEKSAADLFSLQTVLTRNYTD